MINLFGEKITFYKSKKPVDKVRKNWQNHFQNWCNTLFEIDDTSYGKCGCGAMCDWCDDNTYGKPCVRALNKMLKDEQLTINYKKANFEEIWSGYYFRKEVDIGK